MSFGGNLELFIIVDIVFSSLSRYWNSVLVLMMGVPYSKVFKYLCLCSNFYFFLSLIYNLFILIFFWFMVQIYIFFLFSVFPHYLLEKISPCVENFKVCFLMVLYYMYEVYVLMMLLSSIYPTILLVFIFLLSGDIILISYIVLRNVSRIR